jgi:DNA-binding transcriptional ArsR family regulator
MNYPTQFSYLSVFWVAAAAFVIALLFDLYMRVQNHRSGRLTRAHAGRIDKGLSLLRTQRATKITNDFWQTLTGVSHATASRDLAKLEELNILKKMGKGRGIYYIFPKRKSTHIKR